MKNIIAVSIGAFFGAICRFVISRLNFGPFPLTTLFVNVLGSFILGLIAEIIVEHIRMTETLRHMITTGFISSFTTFSSFILEIIELLIRGEITIAILYPISSILLGLLVFILGVRMAGVISVKQRKEEFELI
ncbi:MAG: CrcB family protein [Dictyoglomus thermophilum]